MGMTYRRYPPEFKEEAVRLVHSSDEKHPLPQIARDLDVSTETLRKRVNQSEIDAGEREGLTTEEKEELRRLRREVEVLREEREIQRAEFDRKVEDWGAKCYHATVELVDPPRMLTKEMLRDYLARFMEHVELDDELIRSAEIRGR